MGRTNHRRFIAVFGAVALATCGTTLATFSASNAWSGVLPAFAGRPNLDSDAGCFPARASAVINVCGGGSREFVIPMDALNNATHTVRGRARGNGTTFTECAGVALFGDGNGGAHATPAGRITSTSFGLITMGNLFVAVDETLHIECNIPSNGGILSVGA